MAKLIDIIASRQPDIDKNKLKNMTIINQLQMLDPAPNFILTATKYLEDHEELKDFFYETLKFVMNRKPDLGYQNAVSRVNENISDTIGDDWEKHNEWVAAIPEYNNKIFKRNILTEFPAVDLPSEITISYIAPSELMPRIQETIDNYVENENKKNAQRMYLPPSKTEQNFKKAIAQFGAEVQDPCQFDTKYSINGIEATVIIKVQGYEQQSHLGGLAFNNIFLDLAVNDLKTALEKEYAGKIRLMD